MHHINQLRSVVALARFRHFGRAADAIGLTQSALSQSIRKVEDLYGVPLFERRNRQVALTSYGELVYKTASQTLDAMSNVEREIRLLRNLETGHLVVHSDPYLTNSLLAPALAGLLMDHPQLRFSARQGYWRDAESHLLEDEIDLYFGMPPDAMHPDIECRILEMPSPLILCRAGHELVSRSQATLAELIKYTIVTPVPPAWYIQWAQAQVDELNQAVDVTDLVILETDSVAMAKTVALQSNALTACLPSEVAEEVSGGELHVLDLENWPNRMYGCLATRRSRAVPPAAELVIERIQQAIRSAYIEADKLPKSGRGNLSPIRVLEPKTRNRGA